VHEYIRFGYLGSIAALPVAAAGKFKNKWL